MKFKYTKYTGDLMDEIVKQLGFSAEELEPEAMAEAKREDRKLK